MSRSIYCSGYILTSTSQAQYPSGITVMSNDTTIEGTAKNLMPIIAENIQPLIVNGTWHTTYSFKAPMWTCGTTTRTFCSSHFWTRSKSVFSTRGRRHLCLVVCDSYPLHRSYTMVPLLPMAVCAIDMLSGKGLKSFFFVQECLLDLPWIGWIYFVQH